MKEEDLKKAIELKNKLDSERELLQFANSHYVDVRVELDENSDHGRILNIDYLLDKDVIKGLRAMAIASIERKIKDLQEELEKL
jgi:hypothetical protein